MEGNGCPNLWDTKRQTKREREREREIKPLELSGWAHTFEGGVGGANGNIRVCGVGRTSYSPLSKSLVGCLK